jgi:hypothetical protein
MFDDAQAIPARRLIHTMTSGLIMLLVSDSVARVRAAGQFSAGAEGGMHRSDRRVAK